MKRFIKLILCAFMVGSLMGCGSSAEPAKPKKTTLKTKKKKTQSDQIELQDKGYYVDVTDDTVYVVFWGKLHNTSKTKAIEYPKITATAKDENGTILGTQEQTGIYISPNDSVVLTTLMDCGSTTPTSVDITVEKPEFTNLDTVASSNFTVENLAEVPSDLGTKVTGQITYNGKKDLDSIAVTAVYKKGDTSVYAEATYLDNEITNGSTTPFEITPMIENVPDHDSIDIYVQEW